MRFAFPVTIAFAAGFVVAQTPGGCEAQNILDVCLAQAQGQAATCGPNDWMCLCDNQVNIVQCYNNCPKDLGKTTAENTRISYCNAAAPLSAASRASAATITPISSVAQEAAVATSATTTASQTSATDAVLGATNTGAASELIAPASGLLVVALGVVGLL